MRNRGERSEGRWRNVGPPRVCPVLDAGSRAGGASLVAFKRVDYLEQFAPRTKIEPEKTVPLPDLGDAATGTCLMVQNPTHVDVGIKGGLAALRINKEKYDVTTLDEDGGTLSTITADNSGFVSVSRQVNYNLYEPNGHEVDHLGNGAYLINQVNSVESGEPLKQDPGGSALQSIGRRDEPSHAG
jgi:hypothetical protein